MSAQVSTEIECILILQNLNLYWILVFYGCMQESIINASQDCADVLTRVPPGPNAHSCAEGIKMHLQWTFNLSKLLHIGSGRLRQAAVPKSKESQSLKCKTLPDDAIPSTSGAATQTHQAKKKKTTTKKKHTDDGVVTDDVRKDPDYQPGGGNEGVEEDRGGGGAE